MVSRVKEKLKKIQLLYGIFIFIRSQIELLIVFPYRAANNYRCFKKYYLSSSDEIIKEVIPILAKNNRLMIPFKFTEKYQKTTFNTFIDDSQYPIIEVDGHEVCFPRKTSKKQILQAVRTHFIEQDVESPHKYIYDKSKLHGHTAILVGASDGLLALEIMDSFEHLFLFESDSNWIEPLKKTLRPYEEKITIVNKFVADKISEGQINLDTYFYDYKYSIDFLQADIEGAACLLLKGAEKILKENKITIALACYHTHSESRDLQKTLENLGYQTWFSNNFVFMWMQKLKEPYIRKGVLYGEKIQ